MPPEHTVDPAAVERALGALHAAERRGADGKGAATADALPADVRAVPAVALARARARMRQGWIVRARAALDEADPALAAPGERVAIALESAMLCVFAGGDMRQPMADADAALASSVELDRVGRAEAERLRARLVLAAATFHEVDADTAARARGRLAAAAGVLEEAGRTDSALSAYFAGTEWASCPAAWVIDFAARAAAAGRADLAGDAHVARAEALLSARTDSEVLEAELRAAEARFTEAGIARGSLAARRVRARAAGDLAALDACAAGFRALDHPAGVLSALMDAAQLAHERGDTAAAARYRNDLHALVEETGMGMSRDSFRMGEIDLLTRAGDFGGAIELGRAAIAAAPGGMRRVLYEQMLANAFGFVGETRQATEHARAAYQAARALGVDAATSGAAVVLANHLDSMRDDAAWAEAAALLREWRIRDGRRGDVAAALQKRELAAQALISRFVYSVQTPGDPALLAAAEREVAAGERMARWIGERAGGRLGEGEAARRLGGLLQTRAQLATLRGDPAGMEEALRAARDVYGGAGLAMESANCDYLIGINRLNLANGDVAAHFGEAERALGSALAYYDGAGMRTQAADTRFMLAQLFSNAAPRVADELAGQLLAAAVGALGDAEGDYDVVRRAYTAGPVLEAQRAKRSIAGKSRRIYDLALRILTAYDVAASTWEWTQRAKARSLADALGGSAAAPARALAALRGNPEALGLAERERELAARVELAPTGEVPALRAGLHTLHARMAADPRLAEYLELRTGAAPIADDLAAMFAPGERCVCVDWIASGDRLFLVAARPGAAPRVVALPVALSRVAAFAREDLGPGAYRFTLRTTSERLRELDPLIAPLAGVSEPGELIVLSPTGPLHAVPLHALEMDGAPLLARNPVAHTPSLGVLRHCLARGGHGHRGSRTAALFGDPSGDRPAAGQMVRELAERFGTDALIGAQVTRDAFLAAVRGRDIVHFQGHARHDRAEPLDSPLVLADGVLTAGEVYALSDVRAELVTLAACESAAAGIAPGDEPLGLIPAFLYAGARATLATLWPVQGESAARVMTRFYDVLARGGAGKADALRTACLELRADPKYAEPYYWAPFVLHGDWH